MPLSARLKCKWQGCPAKFVYQEELREHQATQHIECEGCYRFFHPRGITLHQAHCEDYQQYTLRRERDIQRRCSACAAVIHQGQHFLLIPKLILKTMMTVDILPVSDTVIDHIVLCGPECFLAFARGNDLITDVFGPTPDTMPALYQVIFADGSLSPIYVDARSANSLVKECPTAELGGRMRVPDGRLREINDADLEELKRHPTF